MVVMFEQTKEYRIMGKEELTTGIVGRETVCDLWAVGNGREYSEDGEK